jgi:hypothetical protein
LIGGKCAPRSPVMAHNLIIVLLLQAGTPFAVFSIRNATAAPLFSGLLRWIGLL